MLACLLAWLVGGLGGTKVHPLAVHEGFGAELEDTASRVFFQCAFDLPSPSTHWPARLGHLLRCFEARLSVSERITRGPSGSHPELLDFKHFRENNILVVNTKFFSFFGGACTQEVSSR